MIGVAVIFQFLILGYHRSEPSGGYGNVFQFLILGYASCIPDVCVPGVFFQFLILGYIEPWLGTPKVVLLSIPHFRIPG